MHDCAICGTRHAESPKECEAKAKQVVRQHLSATFDALLREYDTPRVRMMVVNYTVSYMGATYGLHIAE